MFFTGLITIPVVMPYPIALGMWTAITAGCLLLAWRLIVLGSRPKRYGLLLGALAIYLLSMAIRPGQISLLVIAAVALCWWFLNQNRPFLAGLTLSLMAFKPEVAILVPIALLSAGYWRALASWGLGVASIAGLSIGLMGSQALAFWWDSSRFALRLPGFTIHPGGPGAGSGLLAVSLPIAALVITIFTAWRARHRGPEVPVAVGLVASGLLAPQLNIFDLSGLIIAGWLTLRLDPPAWANALMILGYLALELANTNFGALPVPVVEYLWLVALLVLSAKPRPRPLRETEFVGARARRVVVLPAYGAEKTLREVVAAIPKGEVDRILLVDDASIDRTVEVAVDLGIDVIKHPRNLGYGGNQKTCYANALLMGAEVVVMLHPDGQYDPGLVPALCRAIEEGKGDIVLGSRWLGLDPAAAGMPQWKRIGNRFLTATENWVLGLRLSEYHTGYRAYSRRFLQTIPFAENSNDFVFDTQVLVQAAAFGFRIGEIPAVGRYFKEASSVGLKISIIYGLQTLGALAIYFANRLGFPCRWLRPTSIAIGRFGRTTMPQEEAA